VCGATDAAGGVDCDAVCDVGETAQSADCDGACGASEVAASVDCDAVCDAGDSANGPDCFSAFAITNGPANLVAGTTMSITYTAGGGLDGASIALHHSTNGLHTTYGTVSAGTHTMDIGIPFNVVTGDDYNIVVTPSGGSPQTAGPYTMSTFIGFYWNGSEEKMATLDLDGAAIADIGTVGDLATWNGNAFFDAATGVVFVKGINSGIYSLYKMDAYTGAYLGKVPTTAGMVGVLGTPSGTIIGFAWDPSFVGGAEGNGIEYVYTIDPATGTATQLGTVGTGVARLKSWQTATVYDPTRDLVWTAGRGFDGKYYVYGINPSTGATVHTTELEAGTTYPAGMQMNADGDIIAARWNGSEEELFKIDPTLGSTTLLGIIGDLVSWGSQTVMDVANNHYYAFGNAPGGVKKVWKMDVATGVLLDSWVVTTSLLAPLLVY